MVKYIVAYHNFPNFGYICKWPFFDKLSDINVQITLYNYICWEFDKLATESFFGEAKVCLYIFWNFLSICAQTIFCHKSQFFRPAGNVTQQIKKVSPNNVKVNSQQWTNCPDFFDQTDQSNCSDRLALFWTLSTILNDQI